MKCPRCGEEMEEGYIHVSGYGDSWLYWSKAKIQSFWFSHKGAVELIKKSVNQPDKKYWVRQAYRCEKCGLIVFEEKYTLSD